WTRWRKPTAQVWRRNRWPARHLLLAHGGCSVQPGSHADSAGLQQGDVISEVNRTPVHTMKDYHSAISHLPHERPALLLVHRQGIPIFMTVKV
ncbi:MAG: PDZ domain-containing protein, partial [Nitrospinae bacterium]|nr:PDZ domain-containing protein [Nitrospinota bacterium]